MSLLLPSSERLTSPHGIKPRRPTLTSTSIWTTDSITSSLSTHEDRFYKWNMYLNHYFKQFKMITEPGKVGGFTKHVLHFFYNPIYSWTTESNCGRHGYRVKCSESHLLQNRFIILFLYFFSVSVVCLGSIWLWLQYSNHISIRHARVPLRLQRKVLTLKATHNETRQRILLPIRILLSFLKAKDIWEPQL
jgi:hypothetical protein